MTSRMDHEQLRLAPDLLAALRAAVTHAAERGAAFVAPPHLLLGLLDDAPVGAVLAGLVAHERLAKAAAAAAEKPSGVAEVSLSQPGEDGAVPFVRRDTLAFRSRDGARTLYLDADANHVFVEGARRADDVYGAKHLAMGLVGQSVKDREILALFGADPQDVTDAVYGL